jgi:hypothetical protein
MSPDGSQQPPRSTSWTSYYEQSKRLPQIELLTVRYWVEDAGQRIIVRCGGRASQATVQSTT